MDLVDWVDPDDNCGHGCGFGTGGPPAVVTVIGHCGDAGGVEIVGKNQAPSSKHQSRF